jgi:hypothetical protein
MSGDCRVAFSRAMATPTMTSHECTWPPGCSCVTEAKRVRRFSDIGLGCADRVGSAGCLRALAAALLTLRAIATTGVAEWCTPALAAAGMPRVTRQPGLRSSLPT